MNRVREFTFMPDRGLQRALRDDVRAQLGLWNLGHKTIDKVLLVLDEIISNSIDHGYAYRHGANELAVRLTLDARGLEVVFVDPDTPEVVARDLDRRLANATVPPPLDAESGRGMFLIRRALEDILFDWTPGRGMTITGIVSSVSA